MLGAVCAFACMDVTMKRLGESYPASQVTLLRGLSALPILLTVGTLVGQLHAFRPRRWPLHVLRGALVPLEYTALLWGIGFDAVLWQVTPQLHVMLGAGIVVASGVYVLGYARRS